MSRRLLMAITKKSRLHKSLQSLRGIIEGITIDRRVNSEEIEFLKIWLNDLQDLASSDPHREISNLVSAAISDGILTDEERQDILWVVEKFTKEFGFYDRITSDIQRLHGILGGILADGKILYEEIEGLQIWMNEHEHLKTYWPFDEIFSLTTHCLAQDVIDEKMKEQLNSFFFDFCTLDDVKVIVDPKIIQGTHLSGICTMQPEIRFNNSTFCFTGQTMRLERGLFFQAISRLGGNCKDHVSKLVDYLVIGSGGNPCWAYSCYGRKVERAVELRKSGHNIQLIHENDFVDSLLDAGINIR